MFYKLCIRLTVAITAFFAVACNFSEEKDTGRGSEDTSLRLVPAEVPFAAVSAELLEPHCLLCHAGRTPAAGVALDTLDAVTSGTTLRGQKLVVPGNPEGSVLYNVIVTGRMPPASGERPARESIEKLRLWIAAGALSEEQRP